MPAPVVLAVAFCVILQLPCLPFTAPLTCAKVVTPMFAVHCSVDLHQSSNSHG
eukprot:m.385257 g.385257  ORF g.385257 m.385257 type:complete len:53 (-) comp136580_c0_seq1:41-199(-)